MVGFTGVIRYDASRPNGQPRRCLDVGRAAERFGFRARTSFPDGLRQTVDWYLDTLRRSGAALASAQ